MTPPDDLADRATFDALAGAIRAREPVGNVPGASGDYAQISAAIAIYRNNGRAAYLRVLEETFPVVRRLVGAEFFRFAVHEYFYAHPARSPVVVRYGADFPSFLAAFEPAQGLAYLSDVARFEIEWLHAYHAAEVASPLSEKMEKSLMGASADARLTLHPSVRLFTSAHPIHTIWTHNRREKTGNLQVKREGERILIVRPEQQVLTFPLASAPFAALQSLSIGRPLGRALEVGLVANPYATSLAVLREIAFLRVVVDIDDAN